MLFTAIRLVIASLLLISCIYVPVLLGFAYLITPHTAQGSLLTHRSGKIIGSSLIAQKFTQDKYFWPRPSAVDYAADASGGSNLSPTSPALTKRVQESLTSLGDHPKQPLPVDLVTTSGSGLDPHISVAAAYYQIPRVAAARHLSPEQLHILIESQTSFAWTGTPLINVLLLNLSLDTIN